MEKKLTTTLEDYLEAIYMLIQEKKVARSKDVSHALQVKRSTVTIALKSLTNKDLIYYEPRSFITLTPKGERIARCITKRHNILKEFFIIGLQLPENEAERAACKMEHGMSSLLCKQIRSLVQLLNDDLQFKETFYTKMSDYKKELYCGKDCKDPNDSFDITEFEELNIFDLNLLGLHKEAKIHKILGEGPLKHRLHEMGITHGQTIKVIKSAPLGDPIIVKIRNYQLCLRREEASHILLEA